MSDEPGSGWSPEEARLRAFERAFLRAHAPFSPPAGCPIGWQPTALTPVFYGYRDYDPKGVIHPFAPGGTVTWAQPPPFPLRVFFPSLDGTPFYGRMLEGCGRWPLILLIHGDCPGDNAEQYKRWFQLPMVLARSGYVVVVPQLVHIDQFPSAGSAAHIGQVVQWMRQSWEYAATLLPAPATGLAGHSYGGLNAGLLADQIPVAAVASLSGVWLSWPGDPTQQTIFHSSLPRLFVWGTGGDAELFARLPDSLWDEITLPKHRVVFAGADHYDYIYTTPLPCQHVRGPCGQVGAATADIVTMFFARYLPPELAPDLPSRIPVTLIPPPLDWAHMTDEQKFYAGSHLQGMQAFNGDAQCQVAVTHALPTDRTVPYVLYSPRQAAQDDVRGSDLVPVFTGPDSPGTGGPAPQVQWVDRQSPSAGETVTAGSEVRMHLRTGPVP